MMIVVIIVDLLSVREGGPGSEKLKEKAHEAVIYELMIINVIFFFYLYPKVMIKGIIIQYINHMSM